MNKSELRKLKIGDTIKIKALHYRIGYRSAIRKITSIDEQLGIGVRMFGYNPFWLKKKEIIEKIKSDIK